MSTNSMSQRKQAIVKKIPSLCKIVLLPLICSRMILVPIVVTSFTIRPSVRQRIKLSPFFHGNPSCRNRGSISLTGMKVDISEKRRTNSLKTARAYSRGNQTDSSFTLTESPFVFMEEDNVDQFKELQIKNGNGGLTITEKPGRIISPLPSSSLPSSAEKDSGQNKQEILIAQILVLVAAVLYGTNFTLVKILDDSLPVGISTSLRFALASLVTLPWLIAPPKDKTKDMSSIIGPALAGIEVGMWTSIGYISQAVGLETMDASKSAFICSLAVVFVPVLDMLVGKSMSQKKATGAIMAVCGVALLELTDVSTAAHFSTADFISFVQPVMFGIGFWRMEHSMSRFPTEASRLTAAQLFAVGVVSVIYCLLSGDMNRPDMNVEHILSLLSDFHILGAIAWTGLVTTALTIYMETIALKTLSAAETTLLFSTEPLWGAAFAAVVVGERFGIGAYAGAAMIMAGCVYSNWEKTSAPKDNKIE